MSGRGRGGRGRGGGGGRGRGARGYGPSTSARSNFNSNSRSRNSNQSSKPRSGGGAPQQQQRLVNGMKGAEAHTVSESDRIQFTQLLINFREDHSQDSLTLSTELTNTERKFLHQLAGQLGLKSKSTGKGENRRITVSRLSETKKIAGMAAGGGGGDGSRNDDGAGGQDDESLPVLKVGRMGIDALRSHANRYPPSAVEKAESHLTGSSLLKSMLGVAADGGADNGNDNDDDDDDDACCLACLLWAKGPLPVRSYLARNYYYRMGSRGHSRRTITTGQPQEQRQNPTPTNDEFVSAS
mmetsp:Transcript_25631/g.55493  ORF Transcript_25631/g.55493 Transcript_25631/m.55493 type:complete len:297 (+) Transcript_25631:106-996(+)